MPETPRPERETQNRVAALFTGKLGYRHLGDWSRRENHAVEEEILREHLSALNRHSEEQIADAIRQLKSAADETGGGLYNTNMRAYQLLRYGAEVQDAADKKHDTVHFIDWENPGNNDFALAEEVTLSREGYERRPDIVLYVNGVAVAVMELKRCSVDIADGVNQLVSNQDAIFNRRFFNTVQLLFAGNDSQGLLYGTTGTPEQFFTQWKDENKKQSAATAKAGENLDAPLAQMCGKKRLLDLIHNFVIFDGGVKKVPRPHQFFGVKAAQKRIAENDPENKGGVIWHTQGSGKSILMVLLAKWVLENHHDARILIVTDRDELDKQIEIVMKNAGVTGEDDPSPRITSRAGFVKHLGTMTSRVLCALIHKFNPENLKGKPPEVKGRFFVFVDECHRTQGGRMNKQMKRWLKDATFIGFTGTPLLKKDAAKLRTRHIFGSFIHTYKFQDGVDDGVILDLKYEARDVPQRLTSRDAIDKWFEKKTKGLSDYKKAALRQNWATMEGLMSAKGRKQKIIASIIADFDLKPRLNQEQGGGTAMLVAPTIYDACHYFRLLQNEPFGEKCGIVTSYQPNPKKALGKSAKSDERYKFETYNKLLKENGQTPEQYEDDVKRRFIKEPHNMRLLIVVDKLLTGFDAPSCTYIYLDSKLRDHNLFQAICRTNRLDGDDKTYGHIVDFKKMLEQVQEAVSIYNSDNLDPDSAGGEVQINDWLKEGRGKLDEALESLRSMCELVPQPREIEQYLRYFCGDSSDENALKEKEPLRIAFYKAVATFARAYAELSHDLAEAGYSDEEAAAMKDAVVFYTDLRSSVKICADELIDAGRYEADMRHLLNTYIHAEPAVMLEGLEDDMPLTEHIIKSGINDAIVEELKKKSKLSDAAAAEAIINNIRKIILRHKLSDPKFYKEMSELLGDLIAQSRADAENYREFLRKAKALAKRLGDKYSKDGGPPELRGKPEAAAVYNNLPKKYRGEERLERALNIDNLMKGNVPARWKGNQAREKLVKQLLLALLDNDRDAVREIFDIIKNQDKYK